MLPHNELPKVIQTLIGQCQEPQPQPLPTDPADLDEGRYAVVFGQREFQPNDLTGGDGRFAFQADAAQADIVNQDILVLAFELLHGGCGLGGIHLTDGGGQAAGNTRMAAMLENSGH